MLLFQFCSMINQNRNSVELVGESGPAIEFKRTLRGGSILRWIMACEETHPFHLDGKIYSTETQYHRLCANGDLAEFVKQSVEPGQMLAVKGQLLTYLQENEDGEMVEQTEVWVQALEIIPVQKPEGFDALHPEVP